jgi:rhodanese-related sulfurtransferase
MKTAMIIATLIIISVAGYAQEVNKITSEDLSVMLADGGDIQLVDVRTPEEVSYGVIEGAVILDYYDGAFRAKADQLDKDIPTVVYCAVGGRSAYASSIFKELGFNRVYDLTDGFRGWKSKGYQVSKGQ